MKTRTELVLDFMLALAQNSNMTPCGKSDREIARDIFLLSAELTDKYLGIVGGNALLYQVYSDIVLW